MSVPDSAHGSDRATSPEVTLPDEVRVVNVGLPAFAVATRDQGAATQEIDWRIPAGGDPDLVAVLSRLRGRAGEVIDEANREVVRRLDEASPRIVTVAPVGEVAVDLPDRTVLHSGPPLDYGALCDPLRRSVRAAIVAEGWAADPDAADAAATAGEVLLAPANHHGGSVPMATAAGPSAPALVAEDQRSGTRGFSTLNQGPGRTPWMGVDSPEAIARLVWLRDVAGPVLDATIRRCGPIDVWHLAAQGLQMGDDLHMRTQAATNLLLRSWLPHLVALDDGRCAEVAEFLASNHMFFLNVAMAGAKAVVDGAAQVPGASIVVSMARNGTTFGIRVAGTGDRWFVAPAPAVGAALYHDPYGEDDAAPDIGDSALLELVGLGGAAAAASPAVAGFLGGTLAEAVATTESFEQLCVGRSTRFQMPYLDHRGTPLGVDVRTVVELEQTPTINTGILDAHEGRGQVGAGVASAPLECFQAAARALDEHLVQAPPHARS